MLADDPPPEGLPPPRSARVGWLELGARIVLPACAALALVSYLTGSGVRIDEELHLIAPARALPGSALPVRAHFYTDLNAIEGARLAQPQVTVSLLDPGGAELTRAALKPGLGGSLEASLAVPRGSSSAEHALRLETRVAERLVQVQAPLALGAPATPQAPEPRALRALQGLSLGPVEALGGQPPDALMLRVAGGACVPEAECVLHVHVGRPAAALAIEPSPSAETLSAPLPAPETSGVVSLRVKVHGPEAYLTLVASRSGQPVARRRVRLPVALGAGALALDGQLYDAPARPRLSLGPDTGPCLVDAWRNGLWLRSTTRHDCGAPAPAPFAPLEPGLWRLQARRDPFAADAAGVAVLHVRPPGQSAAERLHELAVAALARAPDDSFARQVLALPEPHAAALEASAGYLLAVLEEGLIPQPTPHSSMPAARAQLALQREQARDAALLLLVLSGLTLVLLVLHRGLSAAARAGQLMQDAGESADELRRHRLRRVAAVALSAALLTLAFVAIALYVNLRQ